MDSPFPSWITKTMIRGVKGFNLDAYLMALEGWRRGLTLTWYLDPSEETDLKLIGFNPLGKSFSLKNNENGKVHYFYRSRGDLVSNEAVDIVQDKYKTKQMLLEAGVPTPKGFKFEKNEKIEQIIEKFNQEGLNYPVVIKPVFGSLGKGVIINIKNKEELKNALIETNNSEDRYNSYVIEEHIEGEEFRLYVIGDEVVAATKRVPANVVGDGKSTIKELIEEKNKLRKENPYLRKKLIKIDDSVENFIKNKGLSLESIPEKDELVYLKGPSNIAAGGDPIDATDRISAVAKTVAVSAVKAIPHLIHAGVDIIVNKEEAYIIEINSTADIVLHLFPIEGHPRNVPEKIIDYYFPETKGYAKEKTQLYFDYREINKILRNKLAQKLVITNSPKGKLYSKKFIVSGKVQKVGYRNWIKKQALKKGLHGYTRNLKSGKVEVVIYSDDLDKINSFKNICSKGPKKAKVEGIKELECKSSLKIGFEIRKTL